MLYFTTYKQYSIVLPLQEYWITCKYSGKAGEGAENPIAATKKSFLGFQFIRPMPEGSK